MAEHTMLELSVAHGLLHHERFRPRSFTPVVVRASLAKLSGKSQLVQSLLSQQHGIENASARMAELLKRVESKTLSPSEKQWLSAHQDGVRRIVNRLDPAEASGGLRRMLVSLQESPILFNEEKAIVWHALNHPLFAPNESTAIDPEMIRLALSEKQTAEEREHLARKLNGLLRDPPPAELPSNTMKALRTLFQRVLLLSPSDLFLGQSPSDWSGLVKAAALLRGTSPLDLSGLWDLLHYGANFQHANAAALVHPHHGVHDYTVALLHGIASALSDQKISVGENLSAELSRAASSESKWRRFIRGIRTV